MESNILTRKLTVEEQREILVTLFSFSIKDNEGNNHFVVFDDEGNEFYGSEFNCQFDFSTLAGIFSYAAHISKERGALNKQWEIKKALGI